MTTLSDRPHTALVVIDVQNGVVTGAHERDAVVANMDDRPLLPMPSLERFDEQFRPMDGGATAGA